MSIMNASCMYEMQLEREASPEQGGKLSDMEREDYHKRIDDLQNAVSTLLDANNAMGEKLEQTKAAYEDLKAKYDKLEGELTMRKRGQHGKKSEKPKDASSSSDENTKDDDENDELPKGRRDYDLITEEVLC